MPNFYCYKMTYDTGFAPNPYHGVLTLATCKPHIREHATETEGDWIAGWTATTVRNCDEKIIHSGKVGEEQLIYLAKVTKKLTFDKYWKQYPQKRPTPISGVSTNGCTLHRGCGHKVEINAIHNNSINELFINSLGDNIYKPIDNTNPIVYEQISPLFHHDEDDIKHDLSVKNVLICEEFYYFGAEHPYIVNENHPKLCRDYRLFNEKSPEFEIVRQIRKSCKKGIQK